MSELVGHHNGKVLVETFDWVSWLEKIFKKFDGILMYQHFKFSNKTPGKVFCYKTLDSIPVEKKLLRKEDEDPVEYLTTTSPEILSPEGLNKERQTYLFNHIREFCKSGTEDYVAPHPTNKKRR